MFNTIVGAGTVGAGAVSRYGSGSGSDQKMRLRLRLRNTDFQCRNVSLFRSALPGAQRPWSSVTKFANLLGQWCRIEGHASTVFR
jgi:hypothetical protein